MMSSADHVDRSRSFTLWLPFEHQWTLHHLLLDRIQGGTEGGRQTEGPHQVDVYEAFEILDGGDLRFTVDQVEAMQRVLRTSRHSVTSGQGQRDRIDQLLDRLSIPLAKHRSTAQADRRDTRELPFRIDGSPE